MTPEEWMSFNVKAIDARYLAEAKRLGMLMLKLVTVMNNVC